MFDGGVSCLQFLGPFGAMPASTRCLVPVTVRGASLEIDLGARTATVRGRDLCGVLCTFIYPFDNLNDVIQPYKEANTTNTRARVRKVRQLKKKDLT